MTTVTVSTPSLPEVVNVIPGRGVELDAAESFLALLNAGAPKPKKERGSEPSAAPIDVPLPELIPPPRREAGGVHGEPETRTLAEDILPPETDDVPLGPRGTAPAKGASKEKNSPDVPAQQAEDAAPNDPPEVESVDAVEDVPVGIQKLRARLRQQLDRVSQLLQSIIQVLSGQAAADPALPKDIHAALQALQAQGHAIPVSDDVLTLLKDMWSILQKLQASPLLAEPVLHGAEVLLPLLPQGVMIPDDRPVLVHGTQDLLDALEANMAKLALLFPAKNDRAALPPGQPFGPVGPLLKNIIAAMRSELQQLQEDNQALILRLQESLQARLPQGSPALQDLLARQGLVLQEISPLQAGSPVAADKPVNLQPAAMTVPQDAAPSGVNAQPQQTAAANAVPVAGGQPDVGGQTGSNSQGQNQPLPAPATPASAGATQSAGNASSLSFARVIDQAIQRPLVEQVSFHIKTAIADGSSKITIRLEPAELGRLDIRLTIGFDGKTGVIITADNKQTLTLLQQESQGLARALNDAGLSTDSGSLSFNLRGGEQEWAETERMQASLTYQNQQPEEEDTELSVLTRSYVVNLAEGLDIKI